MGLEHHVRYLEQRLAGFVPASLHAEQIAAYTAALDAAREAGGDAAFMERTGNLLELSRAEWIDRYEGWARVYDALGDAPAARIARAHAAAARGPVDHRGLINAMLAAKQAAPVSAAAQVPALISTLLDHRLDPTDERRDDLAAVWRSCAADPDFDLRRPPARSRLPFADAAVDRLVEWIDALSLPAPEPPPPAAAPPAVDVPPPGTETPPAAAVAAGYRAAAAALADSPANAGLRALYARIDELAERADDGMALLADMAAEDLFTRLARAPLIAAAADTTAADRRDRLIAELEAARSVAEVERVQLLADECTAIESAWTHVLLSVALRPAVLALAETPPPRLAAAEAVAVELFGCGTAALLEAPAIREVFERELFDRGQDTAPPADDGGDPQATRGELVLDVAARARVSAIEWAVAQAGGDGEALVRLLSQRRFATPEAMRDHIAGRIAGCGAPAGGEPMPLVLYGNEIALADLGEALAAPPRPALP